MRGLQPSACRSSSASLLMKYPFVFILSTNMPRAWIPRTASMNLGCSIGSPPVSMTEWIPHACAWSNRRTRSSKPHSVISGALSAALKQCGQL